MDEYTTNKNMYIDLIRMTYGKKSLITMFGGMIDDPRNNFYFTHSVAGGEKVLYTIIKDGFLRPGKDIKHPNIRSPGDLAYVYGNINFSDLNNLDTIFNVCLLFSPRLIFDYGIIFNRGWFKYPRDTSIRIHESDSLEEKYNKLNQIKEYLKNPTFYPFKVSGYMAHEVMIDRQIPLGEYLMAVNCVCSKKYKKRIHKIINKKYPNVKILDCPKDQYGLSIAPSLNDIAIY